MKNTSEDFKNSESSGEKPGITDFFRKQAGKLKHGQFTCPFCRETMSGISAFGAHLKKHCT